MDDVVFLYSLSDMIERGWFLFGGLFQRKGDFTVILFMNSTLAVREKYL